MLHSIGDSLVQRGDAEYTIKHMPEETVFIETQRKPGVHVVFMCEGQS